ncbi:MAG: deoxyribonuclease IV [Candidatus Thermoplasmatota archaeon]
MLLGAHESIAGGVHNALLRGKEDGAECVQIFTKSANQWGAKPILQRDLEMLDDARNEFGIKIVAAHDSYLINLAAPDARAWERSREAFLEEMRRAEFLGLQYLIFHPGAHKGAGEAVGIKRIAEALVWLLDQYPGFRVRLLLETTAGQGTYVGYRFEHLADIMAAVPGRNRVGVCYDTCHSFAAGYDVRTPEGWENTLEEFDAVIGLQHLYAFHLNDCASAMGSRIDRHEQIGEGQIGLEGFRYLVDLPLFRDTPGFLETPPLPDGSPSFARNLKILKEMRLGNP